MIHKKEKSGISCKETDSSRSVMSVTNKMKPRNEKKNPASVLGISLLVMYLLSGLILVLLATFLYRFDLNEETVRIGVMTAYVASGLAGGFLMGKKMQDKKYLWGLLTGIVYFVLLFIISVVSDIVSQEPLTLEAVRILTTFALCAVSGMAGGMIS